MTSAKAVTDQSSATFYDLPEFCLQKERLGLGGNLSKNVMRYSSPKGRDLLGRNRPMLDWVQGRGDAGVFQFALAWAELPDAEVLCKNPFNKRIEGLNFTTVDYLGLSQDLRVVDAAVRGAKEIGVHAVSVGGLMGNFPLTEGLENELCDWLGYNHCVLFPTGWAASFGAIVGLVRPYDCIVMDELAHASLQQGAYAATRNVIKFNHLDNEDAEAKVKQVRAENPHQAILVVTEGMYSMDGDVPALAELLQICQNNDAALLVDICHDLGATGPAGTGTLGLAGLLGQVDIVVGAFSKALCTNGGFMLVNDASAVYPVKFFGGSYTYSTAISPIQASVALKAIRIARSADGDQLRKTLRERSSLLRSVLIERGFELYGGPDAHIVPLRLGREGFGRVACARAFELGLVATVIEFPVVPLGAARYRLSLRPGFTEDQILAAVDRIQQAVKDAGVILKSLANTRQC